MKQHDQEPQLITADALATQLSGSVRTIRAWQAEGRIEVAPLFGAKGEMKD